MAKLPEARFQSMGAFVDAFAMARAQPPVSGEPEAAAAPPETPLELLDTVAAPPPVTARTRSQPPSRHRLPVLLAAVVVAASAGVGLFWRVRHSTPSAGTGHDQAAALEAGPRVLPLEPDAPGRRSMRAPAGHGSMRAPRT